MSTSNYIKERDKDLYRCYRLAWDDPDVKSHEDAVKRAIASPTRKYWISHYQAYRAILSIRKGRVVRGDTPRAEMLRAIWDNYQALEKKSTFAGASPFFIAQFAIALPAPRFFISYSRALSIIAKQKRCHHIR